MGQQACQLPCYTSPLLFTLLCEVTVITGDQTEAPAEEGGLASVTACSLMEGARPLSDPGTPAQADWQPCHWTPPPRHSYRPFGGTFPHTVQHHGSPRQLLTNQLILQQKQTDQLENNGISYSHGHSCRISLKSLPRLFASSS